MTFSVSSKAVKRAGTITPHFLLYHTISAASLFSLLISKLIIATGLVVASALSPSPAKKNAFCTHNLPPVDQVPAEIAALKELRVLALDNNDLKTVPAAIGELSHLQNLLLR